MTGFHRSNRVSMPPNPPAFAHWRFSPRPWYRAMCLRSAPAQNARSPAPVSTATHISSSVWKSFQMRESSSLAGGWSAFITSGRSIVT